MTPTEFVFKARRRLLTYLWRIQTKLTPNKLAEFALPCGGRFMYPLNSAIGKTMYAGGFENAELAFVRHSLQPGAVVIDVGANGGIYAVTAARQIGPTGHVYAFEPATAEVAILRKNVEINNLTNVTVIESAVSHETGTAQFAIADDGALNSLAQTGHPDQHVTKWETVKTITLDDFVRETSIPRVDFLKIDVEGAEKLVLDGAKELLASVTPLTILFESMTVNVGAFGYSVRDFLQELLAQGLSISFINDNGTLTAITEVDDRCGRDFWNFVARN